MMRGRGVTTILIMMVALSMLPKAWAEPPASSAERFLLDSTNRERATRGLPEVEWDNSLAASALQHAEQMAQRGELSHQFPGEPGLELRASDAGARFIALAENVALAPTAADLHNEWMNSAPHRANLLDPEMNMMGVAVVARDGELYAVEDFSHAVAVLTIEQQESELGSLVRARGMQLLSDHDEARRACVTGHEPHSGNRAFYLMRFDAAALDDFPDALNRTMASGHYHQAAVGACANTHDDFGGYRVAVLLY